MYKLFVVVYFVVFGSTIFSVLPSFAADDDGWEAIEAEQFGDSDPGTIGVTDADVEDDWEQLPSPTMEPEEDATASQMQNQTAESAADLPQFREKSKSYRDELYLPSDIRREKLGGDFGKQFAPFRETGGLSYTADESAFIRPRFSLFLGPQFRSYANSLLVDEILRGNQIGFSYRVLDAFFSSDSGLHLSVVMGFINIGDLISDAGDRINGVRDTTYRIGATTEVAMMTRLQLLLGMYYRNNQITANDIGSDGPKETNGLHQRGVYPGFGANYDFYVVPYGRLGLRVYFEPAQIIGCLILCESDDLDADFVDTTAETLTSVSLSFTIGLPPRKRESLNFTWEDF